RRRQIAKPVNGAAQLWVVGMTSHENNQCLLDPLDVTRLQMREPSLLKNHRSIRGRKAIVQSLIPAKEVERASSTPQFASQNSGCSRVIFPRSLTVHLRAPAL